MKKIETLRLITDEKDPQVQAFLLKRRLEEVKGSGGKVVVLKDLKEEHWHWKKV